MGKKDKKKGKGAEKTATKTDKKLMNKMKKELKLLGEDDIETVLAEIEKEEKKKQQIIEKTIDEPSRRVNFSFIPHPDKDELIMFGGEFFDGQKTQVYNDLIFYNIPSNTWTIVKSPGAPPPRSGHQMVATSSNNGQLWLFGGEFISRSQSQFHHYQDLWVFHLSTKKWEKIAAQNGPSPRSGHRMLLHKKKLVVFGGFHDNLRQYKYFNDVHIFDLETFKWQKVEISGSSIPSPRSGCVFLPLPNGKILIHGGYMRESVKKDSDKGIIHADSFILQPDKNESDTTKWKFVQVKMSNPYFSPRCGMSFALSSNCSTAYCFGGVFDVEDEEDELNGEFFNDLFALDLDKIQMRLIEPKKRNEIADVQSNIEEMVVEENSQIEVSNDGVFTVTIGTSNSNPKQVNKTSDVAEVSKQQGPCPRINCGLAVKRGVLYLYGGMFEVKDKTITLNDFHSFDMKKMSGWKVLVDDVSSEMSWIGSDESETSSTEGESDSESSEEG